MISKTYRLKLIDKKQIAKGTFALYFEQPDDLTFSAGQSMRLVLGDSDEGRTFTIASAPHEKHLIFAMRKRSSSFKRKLLSLPMGSTVEADGPFGERFVLHGDSDIPSVFIAGGIGITPLRSMISHILYEKLPYIVTLFYSNKRKEDIAFLDDLHGFEKSNPRFTMVLTLTKDFSNDADWKGERGRVDAKMIAKYIPDITIPYFYVAGSPVMVVSVKDMLEKAGVSTDRIITKKFTGY